MSINGSFGSGANSCQAAPSRAKRRPVDNSPFESGADPIVMSPWYINADRTIWVSVPAGGWESGGLVHQGSKVMKGQKTYWVRPKGTDLAISGRRIDGESPPAHAHLPCCYRSGFQIAALHFPTAGCWEVTATSGNSELRFVTEVR
jgi:hypothetical protein